MISHRICFTLTKKIVGKSLEVTPDYINVDGFVIPRSQALAILNNSVVIYQDKVILDKEVSGTCDDKFGFSYVLESGSTITPLSNSFLEMVSVTVPDIQPETVEVAEVEEGKDTPAPIVEAAPKKRGRKPKATTTASQVVEEAPAKEEVPEFVEEDQEDDELENLKVEDDESEEGEDEVIEDIELEEEDSDEEELAEEPEEPEEPEEDEVDADAEESSELEEFEDGEDEDTEDSSEDEDELEDEIFQLDDE